MDVADLPFEVDVPLLPQGRVDAFPQDDPGSIVSQEGIATTAHAGSDGRDRDSVTPFTSSPQPHQYSAPSTATTTPSMVMLGEALPGEYLDSDPTANVHPFPGSSGRQGSWQEVTEEALPGGASGEMSAAGTPVSDWRPAARSSRTPTFLNSPTPSCPAPG